MTQPATDSEVARIVARLDTLESLPLDEQPAALEAVHDDIAAALERLVPPAAVPG